MELKEEVVEIREAVQLEMAAKHNMESRLSTLEAKFTELECSINDNKSEAEVTVEFGNIAIVKQQDTSTVMTLYKLLYIRW